MLTLLALSLACARPSDGAKASPSDDDHERPGDFKLPRQPKIEEARTVRALEAEVAALERTLAAGKPAHAITGLINAHEHLYKLEHLDNYLPAARRAGVATTVVVASPEFTMMGRGEKGEPGMSENLAVLLEAQAKHPGEIVAFCTIDPKNKDKLKQLQEQVAAGCKGVKIYSGHSNFYDGPLDAPDMMPVFAWLEEKQLPVNWHINLMKFMDDFERVLAAHPKLNVMVPHYGVVFWRPKGPALDRLKTLMRKHPNVLVDTSLGTREILLDGMAAIEPARDAFRAFVEEFQDQIVWGTDSVITGNIEKTPAWYTKVIWATRDHLEKDVFTTELAAAYSKYFKKGRDPDGRYQGLALSPAVLQKVYVDNARRWLRLPAAEPSASAAPSPSPSAG